MAISSAQDKVHWTALEYTASNSQPESCKDLLAHGASPNTQDSDYGWTPLLYAADKGNMEIATMLVEKGADVNVKAKDGLTALQEAPKRNRISTLRTIWPARAR